MDVLDAQAVADSFPLDTAGGAVLGPIYNSAGGYYNIESNPVYVQYGYGSYGDIQWTPPVPIPVGPAILAPGTVAVRFKNYNAGSAAVVSGALSERGEPVVQITSGGISAASGPVTGPTPATTLPAAPVNNEIAVLVDSTVAPTWAWTLQWNVAISRWIFLGGIPAMSMVTTAENTTSGAYTDLATVGPSFVAPVQGTYSVRAYTDARFGAPAGGPDAFVGLKVGANATFDLYRAPNDTGGVMGSGGAAERPANFVAGPGDVIKLQYHTTGGQTGTFENRYLAVIPNLLV